jgi:hypothetical protein
MKEGQQVQFIRDDQAPLKSEVTGLIAAMLASGFKYASDKPLLDTIEEVDGTPRRSVTWSMDGSVKAAFNDETIDVAEFRKRFENRDWCQAHPEHPIAYLRAFNDALSWLRNQLKSLKPLMLIRKGRRFALIPQDADPIKKAELLAML